MTESRQQTLRARRNTPFAYNFEVTNADGSAMDLTGHSGTMEVRLHGMQSGAALVSLESVTDELTQGVRIVGAGEVSAYINELDLLFMPEGAAGLDVTFAYDLVLSDADGGTWVERYGSLILTEGVTSSGFVFLSTDTGALLTTADGTYLEII